VVGSRRGSFERDAPRERPYPAADGQSKRCGPCSAFRELRAVAAVAKCLFALYA